MEPSPFAKKLSAIYGFVYEASRQTALSFDKNFFAFAFIISAAIIFFFIYGIYGLDAAYNPDIGRNPEVGADIEAPRLSQLQTANAAGIAPAQEINPPTFSRGIIPREKGSKPPFIPAVEPRGIREGGRINQPGGENPVDAPTPQAGKIPPYSTAPSSASSATGQEQSQLRLPSAGGGQISAIDSPANYRAQIIIPAIGVDSIIVEPASADFSVLNKSLTKGVVHYPGSALPWENGNTFLFGHSAGNFTVRNKAYAVFNRLAELRNGDIIRLQYGNNEYWYRVTSLAIKKADQALVDLVSTKRMVTLSTCNLFGAKDDRYVVEAEFMESYPLRSASASGTSS
ncbi:MAG: class D sortase [Candidatus Sungbacteria bacterium]|nr:class D sortase [Candidatus Sungbacteria bacterium]